MVQEYVVCRSISDKPFICCRVVPVANRFQVCRGYLFVFTEIGNYNRNLLTADIAYLECFPSLVIEWIVWKR